MSYITNMYSWVKFICGNHDDDNIKLEYKQGPHSLFYACPKYYEENRSPGERMCVNRLSILEGEKIFEYIADMLSKADENDEIIDLTNHSWKKNGIECKIVKYSKEEIIVKVLNKKVFSN